jgi:hypothetical protein
MEVYPHWLKKILLFSDPNLHLSTNLVEYSCRFSNDLLLPFGSAILSVCCVFIPPGTLQQNNGIEAMCYSDQKKIVTIEKQ